MVRYRAVGNRRGHTTRSAGSLAARLGRAIALGGLLVATTVACSGGDDDESPARTAAPATSAAKPDAADALPSCADEVHAVVVDVGSMTPGLTELAKWLNDPSYDLQPRPGAVEMLVAWRQKGYLIVYLTGLASSGLVGPDQVPLPLAMGAWQQREGFPVGEGTRLLMWDQAAFADVTTFRIDAMVHLSLEGVELDYGYTDDLHDVLAYRNGGMPVEHIFTIQGEGDPGPDGVREQDWASHKARVVDPLPPVCQP